MNTEAPHAYRPGQSDTRSAWNTETLAVAAFLAGIVASRSRLARWGLLAAAGGWLWSKMRHPKPADESTAQADEPSNVESYIDDAWARHEAEQESLEPASEDTSVILSAITAAVTHEAPVEAEAPPALAALFAPVSEPAMAEVAPEPEVEPPSASEVMITAAEEVTAVEALAQPESNRAEDEPVTVIEAPMVAAHEAANESVVSCPFTVVETAPTVAAIEAPAAAETSHEVIPPAIESDMAENTPDDHAEAISATLNDLVETSELNSSAVVDAEETIEPVSVPAKSETQTIVPTQAVTDAVPDSEPQPLFGAPENLTIASMLGGDQRVFELPAAPAVAAATMRDLDLAFAKVGRDTPASPFVMPSAQSGSPFAMPETQAPTLAEQIAANMSAALLSVPAAKEAGEPTSPELPVAQATTPSAAPDTADAADTDDDEPLGKSAAWLLGIEPTSTVAAVDREIPVVKHDTRPLTAPIAEGKALPDVIEIPEATPNAALHPEIDALVPKDMPLRPITKGLLSKVLETTSERPVTAPLPAVPAIEPAPAPPAATEPPLTFRLPPPRPPQRPQSWIAAELAREAEEKAGAQVKTTPPEDTTNKPVTPQAPAVAATPDKKAWIDWWK